MGEGRLSRPVGWDALQLSTGAGRFHDLPTELNMRRRGQWSDCPLNLRTAVLDVPLTVDVAVGLNWAEAH